MIGFRRTKRIRRKWSSTVQYCTVLHSILTEVVLLWMEKCLQVVQDTQSVSDGIWPPWPDTTHPLEHAAVP
jgi:hypothetical protein